MWNDLENNVVLYADDTTLYVEVTSLSDCIIIANFLNRDLSQFNHGVQRGE